jgi:asparagine synthase (glutamine-hydrolysing)
MCSISGEINWRKEILCSGEMAAVMARRGPDDSGNVILPCGVFQHNRLAVMDPENGRQPMTVTHRGRQYTIVYNGELYNARELRTVLRTLGFVPKTNCDTEIVLLGYIALGEACVEAFNGIFAFCIYDEAKQQVYFARDRLGVKPFFYANVRGSFLFASEIKGLLASGKVSADLDRQGLWQLLFLAPAKLPGSGIFKDVRELLPGQCGVFDRDGMRLWQYWHLPAEELRVGADEAAEAVRTLLTDAIRRQLRSDVPLATLLSGGLDSTIVTAVAAEYCREQGTVLDTYSFEYEGNRENFHSTLFQPQGDDAFATYAADYLGTRHTVLTAPTDAVAACLYDAALARDMPGQADIDSSLVWFCRQIKNRHTVVLSGECADEIFGGYPWFYRPEMLYSDFFPWIHDPMLRASVFDETLVHSQQGYAFISQCYRDSIASCPSLPSDSSSMATARAATWLSVNYFMASLLERKDRMSMYSGVEVRVPFADHRILEYVYNVPWEIKYDKGVEKALLRRAMSALLPPRVLTRKKSPYPKTHNPLYTQMVTDLLKSRLDQNGFLRQALRREKLETLLAGENTTWFGQLMGTPQLIAWLIQLDYWFEQYHVNYTDN